MLESAPSCQTEVWELSPNVRSTLTYGSELSILSLINPMTSLNRLGKYSGFIPTPYRLNPDLAPRRNMTMDIRSGSKGSRNCVVIPNASQVGINGAMSCIQLSIWATKA